MTLLDLQTMETPKAETTDEFTGGGGGGSRASLLLCGDSSLSITTCN
ncbi:SapB/AmfS family lanthipeptide [Streptomyces sp. Pv4-95]